MPILMFVCIIPLTILYVPEKSSLLLIPFIPLIILLAASASALFYIELTENELILKMRHAGSGIRHTLIKQ